MTFSEALDCLKAGRAVSHPRLSGFISMTDAARVPSEKIWSPHNRNIAQQCEAVLGRPIDVTPSITHCIPIGDAPRIVMGWTPAQEDLFRDDWVIYA